MRASPVKCLAFLIIFLFTMSIAPVWATDSTDPKSNPQIPYGTGVGKKLGRGIGNLAFGWMDVLGGIESAGTDENWIAAITWGPLMGASHAVGRTLAGAYEVATCPVPYPANFEPIVKPEFVIKTDKAGER